MNSKFPVLQINSNISFSPQLKHCIITSSLLFILLTSSGQTNVAVNQAISRALLSIRDLGRSLCCFYRASVREPCVEAMGSLDVLAKTYQKFSTIPLTPILVLYTIHVEGLTWKEHGMLIMWLSVLLFRDKSSLSLIAAPPSLWYFQPVWRWKRQQRGESHSLVLVVGTFCKERNAFSIFLQENQAAVIVNICC